MKDSLQSFLNVLKAAHTKQHDQQDCGPACLQTILKLYGKNATLETLRQRSGTTSEGTTLLGLQECLSTYGIKSEGYQADLQDLTGLHFPAVLHVETDLGGLHYIFLFKTKEGRLLISDPGKIQPEIIELNELGRSWKSGRLLTVEVDASKSARKARNDSTIQQIWPIIKQRKGLFFVVLTLGVLSAFLELTTALYTQQLVDKLLPEKLMSDIKWSLLAWIVLLVFGTVLSFVRQYLLADQALQVNTRLIDHFLGKLLLQPKSFFDSKKTGDLVARLNDTEKIEDFIRQLVSSTAIHFVFLIVGLLFLMLYHSDISLLLAINLFAFICFSYLYGQKIAESQRLAMINYATTESAYIDQIKFVEEIKMVNREKQYQRKVIDQYHTYQRALNELEKLSARFRLGLELISTITVGCILANAVILVLSNVVSIGGLVAILPISMMVLNASSQLTTVNIDLQGAKVALARAKDFAGDDALNQRPLTTNVFEQIVIRDLFFHFPGRLHLLQGVDLELSKGKINCLLGESGSGKSTIIKLFQRFYDYSRGSIKVNSDELSNLDVESWRSRIAVVPQDIHH